MSIETRLATFIPTDKLDYLFGLLFVFSIAFSQTESHLGYMFINENTIR